MPFVSISLPADKPDSYRARLSSLIHHAMVDTIHCPPETLYHEITGMRPADRMYLAEYRGMQHGPDMVFIRMILKEGRSAEQKKAMYLRIAEDLNRELGLSTENLFITLTENKAEDWFFGLPAQP